MVRRGGRGLLFALVFLAASGSASAQYEVGIRVPNWTVPPYGGSRPAGELSTMTDTSPGVAFVAMQPCRVFDTRNANGPYGGPRLLANVTRNFDIDSGPCTGIPTGVDAYSMNFGAILADGIGFVTIWPTGVTRPTVSSINTIPGYVLANAAIVPVGTNGSISVFPNTGMHLYGDINGYFTDQYNPGVSFHAVSSTAPAIIGENTGSGYGVLGTSVNGFGVVATTGGSASNAAVYASNTSSGDGASGVYGQHGSFGYGYGVFGLTNDAAQSSGVLGVGRGGRVSPGAGFLFASGIRGESYSGIGVLGLTVQNGSPDQKSSIKGVVVDTFGAVLSAAVLGLTYGSTNYGLSVSGDAQVIGNFSALSKSFVEPHPYDASKEIRYISLEGPHAEVYFRGTAQIAQGITRIPIPQDFRFVADAQTYSTLVTPLGGMATVAVLSEGSDGIVVQASRDVKVHYVVYAERSAIKNPDPIVENVDFRPLGDFDVFHSLPESYRRLLEQNGTLSPDGSVNRETARRLGWSLPDELVKPISQPSSN